MSFIGRLTEDLLYQVFGWLNDDCQTHLLSITLVCKAWHAVAQTVIDGDLKLIITANRAKRNLQVFARVQNSEPFCRRVHQVTVLDWHHDELEKLQDRRILYGVPNPNGTYPNATYDDSATWRSTVSQIHGLARSLHALDLLAFVWAAVPPLPTCLAEAVSCQRRCHLNILQNSSTLWTATWAYTSMCDQRVASNLHRCADRLTTLDIVVASTDIEGLSAFGNLLASTSILRTLRLHAHGRHPGILRYPPTVPRGGWTKDRFLVRNLEWVAKPLLGSSKKLRLRELSLVNFCVCETHLRDDIGQYLELKSLTSLSVSCFGIIVLCQSDVPSLRRLSVHFRNESTEDCRKCITDWPAECVVSHVRKWKELQHLELIDRPDILNEELLSRMGQTLETLDVHRTSPLHNPFKSFSNQEGLPECPAGLMQSLAEHCFRLRELTISAPTPSEEFEAFLREVAQIRSLTRLGIHRSVEPYQEGYQDKNLQGITCQNIMEIWKALACHGSTLQCLQICLESHKSPQDYNHMREPRYADREGGRQLVVRRSQQEVEVHMPEAMHVQRSVQHGAPQPSDNYWMRRLDILRKLACQGLGLRLVDRRMWATVRYPEPIMEVFQLLVPTTFGDSEMVT